MLSDDYGPGRTFQIGKLVKGSIGIDDGFDTVMDYPRDGSTIEIGYGVSVEIDGKEIFGLITTLDREKREMSVTFPMEIKEKFEKWLMGEYYEPSNP